MKFKEKHRKDILQLFSEQGISKEHYSFQKRKGRIIISFGTTEKFSFYQTKDFDIDMVTKARIDTSHFEVKINNEISSSVDNWQLVKVLLNKWIMQLKHN